MDEWVHFRILCNGKGLLAFLGRRKNFPKMIDAKTQMRLLNTFRFRIYTKTGAWG